MKKLLSISLICLITIQLGAVYANASDETSITINAAQLSESGWWAPTSAGTYSITEEAIELSAGKRIYHPVTITEAGYYKVTLNHRTSGSGTPYIRIGTYTAPSTYNYLCEYANDNTSYESNDVGYLELAEGVNNVLFVAQTATAYIKSFTLTKVSENFSVIQISKKNTGTAFTVYDADGITGSTQQNYLKDYWMQFPSSYSLTFSASVAEAGSYRVYMPISCKMTGPHAVSLTSGTTIESGDLNTTSALNRFIQREIGTLTLNSGENTFTITATKSSTSNPVNVSFIVLEKLPEIDNSLKSIEVTSLVFDSDTQVTATVKKLKADTGTEDNKIILAIYDGNMLSSIETKNIDVSTINVGESISITHTIDLEDGTKTKAFIIDFNNLRPYYGAVER